MSINMGLAASRNLSVETIIKIEQLHDTRGTVHKAIRSATLAQSKEVVYALASSLPSIETALQVLWGFPTDINYYRFWEVPCCICPRMDNEDSYPSGYYVINSQCWLHGDSK